ncbi:MAG: CidA/LrgA family protein [Gammaproteobacteria bacterium]|nr:MAG: CidA/LrgA family protein [Gammaproteobacteria bacterium]
MRPELRRAGGRLAGLLVLLICLAAGEALVRLSGLPVPGAVPGMLLLYAMLLYLRRVGEGLAAVSTGLLAWLGLFFVPAGVGIVVHAEVLRPVALQIVAVMVLSTLLTLIVTALAMAGLMALSGRRRAR